MTNTHETEKMENHVEWLLELLSHNKFISMNDDIGTFVARLNNGWEVCGRDDVMKQLIRRRFNTLSMALLVAKSAKNISETNQ